MVQNTKTGEEAVFREIFYKYSNKLYHYLLFKTRSEYFANEVTQLTFIKLWKNRKVIRADIKLSTQIFQIAKTTLIDELRKEERSKINLKKLHIRENIFKPEEKSGYEWIEEKELLAMVDLAVRKLPPVRKKVFQLRGQEHLSYKEISDMLSISVKTVDKHMQLAIRSLRPVIKNNFLIALLLIDLSFYPL